MSFLICENGPRKNCIFALSLEIAAFQRARKSCRTFRQCTFSFDNLLHFLILARVIAQEAPKTLKWPSGCAHLLVHIRRPLLKKCRSPDQEKCRKSASESAGPKTGCRGKCRKKCSRSRLLYYLYIGAGPGALFSALSSAPRFGPALPEALFRHFSWPGLRHFFRWPPGL